MSYRGQYKLDARGGAGGRGQTARVQTTSLANHSDFFYFPEIPEVAVFFTGSSALTHSMLQLTALIFNFFYSFWKLEGFFKASLGSNRKNGACYSSTADTVAAH